MTKLFLVGGPIGNLEDLTFRAKRILAEADFLISEEPLTTKKIFDRYQIDWPPNLKLNERNFERQLLRLKEILVGFKNIVFMSEAGAPGLSDPGNRLVEFVRKNFSQIEIEPIPGVSSLTTLISVSGENLQRFLFLGFLPQKNKRKFFLAQIQNSPYPVILFESPFRLNRLLTELAELGFTKVVLGRELTKKFEEIKILDLNVIDRSKLKLKGEITLIVFPRS